jgi:hypothetical protein
MNIFGERIDAAGIPIDTAPVLVVPPVTIRSGAQRPGKVFASASNGRDTIVITGNRAYYDTDDWRSTEAAIFKSLPEIDTEPANRRHAPIASAAPEQSSASIASNGVSSLVTWRERSGLNPTVIRAAFIDGTGQVGPPIDIGEAYTETPTATASNGRDFLISYVDPDFVVVARRVTLEGLVDAHPRKLAFGQADPFDPYGIAIAWSGYEYLVANTGSEGSEGLLLTGVLPDGRVDAKANTCGVSSRRTDVTAAPAIQCGSGGCATTWHTTTYPRIGETSIDETNTFCFAGVYGNRQSKDMDFTMTLLSPAVSMPLSDGKALFIYSNGTSMFAGRITSSGVVLDPPEINGGVSIMTSKTSFPLQPAAVVDNGLYFVEPDTATTGRLDWARIEAEPKPHISRRVNLFEHVTLPVTLTATALNTYVVYGGGELDPNLAAPRLFLRIFASPDAQPSPVRRRAVH